MPALPSQYLKYTLETTSKTSAKELTTKDIANIAKAYVQVAQDPPPQHHVHILRFMITDADGLLFLMYFPLSKICSVCGIHQKAKHHESTLSL